MSAQGDNHTNVRIPPDAFIGRTHELARVADLCAQHRLLTITGPAGVGKTRLASRYGRDALASFPGGVWFCDLAAASTPEDVCRIVGKVLEFRLPSGVDLEPLSSEVAEKLRERQQALLILDNFEQLTDAAKTTVGVWLDNRVTRFLVTSRERLRIHGEVVFPLGPLPTPPDGREAEALFLERARAASGASLRVEDLSAVAEIVRYLDGLPLAIELAAARVGTVLSPSGLLGLVPRSFDVLGHGARDAPARHQTMRRAIEWSWELLSRPEQRALMQASVFEQTFSLQAAEQVLEIDAADEVAGVLDVMQALRDKSLAVSDTQHGCIRFSLLSCIRDFAAEKLAEPQRTATRWRHLDFYGRLGAALTRGAMDRDAGALLMITLEQRNLEAAAEFGLGSQRGHLERERALWALVVLGALIPLRGASSRYLELLDSVLDAPKDPALPSAALARAFEIRGRARMAAGTLDVAREDLHRAVELARSAEDTPLSMRLRCVLAMHFRACGRPHDARRELDEVGRLLELRPDPHASAVLSLHRGTLDLDEGRLHLARRAWDRARRLFQETGDSWGEAAARGNLGLVHANAGDWSEAESCYRFAMQAYARFDDACNEAGMIGNLARLYQEQGRYREAVLLYERAVSLLTKSGNRRRAALWTTFRATMLHELGDVHAALALYEEGFGYVRRGQDARVEGILRCYLGFALAQLGRDDDAAAMLAESERLLLGAGDVAALAAVRLLRAGYRHDQVVVEELRTLAPTSQDARLALRILRHAAGRSLRLGPRGAWFELSSAPRVLLERREVLRRVLVALVRARETAPGQPQSAVQLARAGWPAERLPKRAGSNRVRVALATLRKMGLGPVLATKPGGWLLDSRLAIERVEASAGSRRQPGTAHRTIVIGTEGRWFRLGAEPPVDLSRRGALRRLLRELAANGDASPRKALTVSDLFAAGWPGERARHEDAVQRVYTSIRRLRRLGLHDMLLRRDDGYLLSDAVTVRVAPPGAEP